MRYTKQITKIYQQKIDYDKISKTYNRRYEHNRLSEVIEELKKTITLNRNSIMMDVGCGTAYWLDHFSNDTSNLFGVDLSFGMLQKAAQRNKYFKLVQASAEFLPYKEKSFDIIICINALHFFNTNHFINECSTLLKPNGNIVLVVLDLHNPESYWYAYNYFKSIKEYDYNRFESIDKIEDNLKQNNFRKVSHKIVQVVEDVFINKEVFKDPFLKKEESSTLAWLSDEEYLNGLDKIKKAVSGADERNEKITFNKKFHFALISAQR